MRKRKEMKRTHESMHVIFYDDVLCDMINKDFMLDLLVCMSLNGTEHMYVVTTRMYTMI
jgi:hypothetical protein